VKPLILEGYLRDQKVRIQSTDPHTLRAWLEKTGWRWLGPAEPKMWARHFRDNGCMLIIKELSEQNT
jgi:hypothetical protein